MVGTDGKQYEGRLSAFSVVTKLTTTDSKSYETYIYNEKKATVLNDDFFI